MADNGACVTEEIVHTKENGVETATPDYYEFADIPFEVDVSTDPYTEGEIHLPRESIGLGSVRKAVYVTSE